MLWRLRTRRIIIEKQHVPKPRDETNLGPHPPHTQLLSEKKHSRGICGVIQVHSTFLSEMFDTFVILRTFHASCWLAIEWIKEINLNVPSSFFFFMKTKQDQDARRVRKVSFRCILLGVTDLVRLRK